MTQYVNAERIECLDFYFR